MRRAFAAADKIIKPLAKFVERIHHAIAGNSSAASRPEQAFIQDLLDGTIGGVIVFEGLSHDPAQTIPAVVRETDAAMHGGRAKIDQNTFRLEDSVRFAEGMDHALVGHSSQRPGEHDDVERRVGMFKLFGAAGLKRNLLAKLFRQRFSRISNDLGIRFDGVGARAEPGEPLRQAALTTADLEHVLAAPVRDLLKRPYLVLFRINAKCHFRWTAARQYI